MDRNFNDLVGHFQKNIYQTPKGQIRLDIIWRDLLAVLPAIIDGPKLRILDAGAGPGYMAGMLADHGHELVLCDVSDEILKQAEQHLSQNHPQAAYRLINSAVQELKSHINEQFDLVLFHAVLEWLQDPRQVLISLLDFIRPDGHLSLMFYNKHSLIYRHLLNANFKVLLQGDPRVGERLVPISPLDPKQVENWLMEEGVDIVSQSGVRVIYDYLSHAEKQRIKIDELLEMERRYSRLQPYSDLARYQHFIIKS